MIFGPFYQLFYKAWMSLFAHLIPLGKQGCPSGQIELTTRWVEGISPFSIQYQKPRGQQQLWLHPPSLQMLCRFPHRWLMFLFLLGYSFPRLTAALAPESKECSCFCVLSAINCTALTGPLLVVYSTFQMFGLFLTGLSKTACAIYCFIWSRACCCSGPAQVVFFSWCLGAVGSWADFIWVCIFTKILPFQIKFVSFYVCRWNNCRSLINHVSMKTVVAMLLFDTQKLYF